MKKLYILISLMFIAATGFAQWVAQTSGTINDLYSVYFTNTDTGYAVGLYGTILKTNNGGMNWNNISIGTNSILCSVFFLDNDTGYIVGMSDTNYYISDGMFWKTKNGGNSWTSQTVPCYCAALYSVYFPTADTGCIVGSSEGVVGSIDYGNNWAQQAIYNGVPPAQMLNSVYFTNSKTGYAVGYGGIFLKTTNGGTAWYTQDIGTTTPLMSVYFPNNLVGYIVGKDGIILKTIDGGNGWIQQTSGTTNWLTSVFFADINTGYAVGDSGSILKTINGGSTWTMQNSGTTEWLTSVFFTDANTGYIVGRNGTILKTTNGGQFIKENQLPGSAINIFPNPTNNNLTLETTEKATIEILNIAGQIIKTVNTADKQTSIDVSNLSSGVYIIKAKTDRGVVVKKFIKE